MWTLWLVVGVIGWYLAVFRGQEKRSALHWMALPYALLLASTAGVVTGLAVQDPVFWPMAIGAALFVLSDLIIAGRLFNPRPLGSQRHSDLIDNTIWLTYGPGQMLIVYSVGSVRGAMAAR